MAQSASEYHHGDQDITEQVATFHLFTGMTKWGSLVIGDLILMLALWFCTGVGFLAAGATFVVIMAIGIFFLREGSHSEEV